MNVVEFLSLLSFVELDRHVDESVRSFLTKHGPRLYCYLETPGLLWVNLAMDLLIAASYAAIFGCLMWIAVKLWNLPGFSKYIFIFVSFGLFIVACGGTHVMEVSNLWWPRFPLTAGIRIACAAASVPTAVIFALVTPSLARNIRSFVEVLVATQEQRDAAQGALTASEAIAVERQRSAEELRLLNDRLRSVMDSTSENVLQVGYDWKILYGNRRSSELLRDFCLGADLWSCFPGLRGTSAETRLRKAMATRIAERFDNFYEPYDAWYKLQAFPVPEGLTIFSQDISVEKKLEASLDRERALREKHVELMSHMAGGLAHEISNPLAIIHARASDLEALAVGDVPLTQKQVSTACANIVRTADRAMRILRGLKGLSREASSDPMEPADLITICQQAVEMQFARFERHNLLLRLMLTPDLPPVVCRETQIGQIVTNLLNNAFDAVTQSSVTERWVSLEAMLAGEYACIRVTDSGPEIGTAVRDRIMEPFFTTKSVGLGTGVGLSLSRAIANDHGGSLMLLDSHANTCFELLLPVASGSDTRDKSLEVAK